MLNPSKLTLVTLDISSLYSNINLKLLHGVIFECDWDLTKYLDFITNYNFLQYDQRIFRQLDGIAMGTNAAPVLANLYLADLLDPHITANRNVRYYKRFLDDLLIFWKGTDEDLTTFIANLNNLIPGIKFTSNRSKQQVEFLDLNIFIQDNDLHFSTHQKVLNKYIYISPKSCHPQHTLTGFIKGELTRYALNSSNYHLYCTTRRLFFARLLARGYQRKFLLPIFNNHKYSNRYKTNINTNTDSLSVFRIRYSYRSKLTYFGRSFKSYLNVQLKQHLPTTRFLIAWKRSRNLQSYACPSKLNSQQSQLLSTENGRRFGPNTTH